MWASQTAQWLNMPAYAGDARDTGLIPGLRRSPGGEKRTNSSIFSGIIPWTEEPGGLRSMGLHGVGHDWATPHSTAWHFNLKIFKAKLMTYPFHVPRASSAAVSIPEKASPSTRQLCPEIQESTWFSPLPPPSCQPIIQLRRFSS